MTGKANWQTSRKLDKRVVCCHSSKERKNWFNFRLVARWGFVTILAGRFNPSYKEVPDSIDLLASEIQKFPSRYCDIAQPKMTLLSLSLHHGIHAVPPMYDCLKFVKSWIGFNHLALSSIQPATEVDHALTWTLWYAVNKHTQNVATFSHHLMQYRRPPMSVYFYKPYDLDWNLDWVPSNPRPKSIKQFCTWLNHKRHTQRPIKQNLLDWDVFRWFRRMFGLCFSIRFPLLSVIVHLKTLVLLTVIIESEYVSQGC